MRGREHGYQPKEVTRKTDRDRTRYWRGKFIASIASYYSQDGLTQTQEPTIRRLVSTIVSNTPNPGEIINPIITDETITPEYGGELWVSLDCLMQDTESVTRQRHRYTPYEFVDSLRGFSNTELTNFQRVDAARKAAQEHQIELGLSPDRRAGLKRHVDQVLENPDFIEAHSRRWGRPEYTVYPYKHAGYEWEERQEQHIREERAFLTSTQLIEQERNRINGTMRSFDTCMFQSEYLLDRLPVVEPDLGFLYAEGTIMPYMGAQGHEIILAVPDFGTKDALLDIQNAVGSFPVLTTAEGRIAEVPSISSITVIDASILQLFANIPFLNDLPHAERIPFVQSIAPGRFSDSGVFVDSYANYVQFLGLMSSFMPDFFVSEQSFRRKSAMHQRNEIC